MRNAIDGERSGSNADNHAESEAAYMLLWTTDRSDEDHKYFYRRDRYRGQWPFPPIGPQDPLLPKEVEEEDTSYHQWRAVFNVEKTSFTPDDLVEALYRITHSTVDERGRKFWRVRRFEDMKNEAIPPSIETGYEQDKHGDDTGVPTQRADSGGLIEGEAPEPCIIPPGSNASSRGKISPNTVREGSSEVLVVRSAASDETLPFEQ